MDSSEPCITLDYDDSKGRLILSSDVDLSKNPMFKVKLKRFMDSESDSLRTGLSVNELKTIQKTLIELASKKNMTLVITPRFSSCIEAMDSHIKERISISMDVKEHRENISSHFEEFSNVVDSMMTRKLRDRQMWDAFYMTVMGRCANFSVPGSGKTSATLGVYAFLKNKGFIKRLLVIGPINCFGAWIDEFQSCFGYKPLIFNVQDKGNRKTKDTINHLRYDTGSVELFLFNYESMNSYMDVIRREIIDDGTLVVLDEVHRIKAVGGKRAKDTLESIEGCKRVIVLTGTPIPNSYMDMYNMMTLILGNDYKDIIGYPPARLSCLYPDERRDLNDRIFPFFCRTSKDDLSVPPANPDRTYEIETTDYENHLLQILKDVLSDSPLALIIRTLQLESDQRMLIHGLDGIAIEEMEVGHVEKTALSPIDGARDEWIESSKTRACIELASSLMNEGKTVVIWCVFKDSIENISEILHDKGYGVRHIYGAVPLDERESILEGFKSGNIQAIVANPHTLAESVSLHTVCHDAIYFEYTYNLVHLLQSKDRIHRLGLPDGQYTQYHILRSVFDIDGDRISLDKAIYDRLSHKEDIMQKAIEGNHLESMPSDEEDIELIMNELFRQ